MDGGGSQWPCGPAALALPAPARSLSGDSCGSAGRGGRAWARSGLGPAGVHRLLSSGNGFISVRVPAVPRPRSLAAAGVPCRQPSVRRVAPERRSRRRLTAQGMSVFPQLLLRPDTAPGVSQFPRSAAAEVRHSSWPTPSAAEPRLYLKLHPQPISHSPHSRRTASLGVSASPVSLTWLQKYQGTDNDQDLCVCCQG